MIKVETSSYFTCLHKGRCQYRKSIKELGKYLIVPDVSKKEYIFIPEECRAYIIDRLNFVDDGILVRDSIDRALEIYRDIQIYAKGGYGTVENFPHEQIEICEKLGIRKVCSVEKNSEE